MMKVLAILFLALFATQVLGIQGFACGDDCAQECASTDSGLMPPPCASCHCCFASQVFMPAAVTSLDSPRFAVPVFVSRDTDRTLPTSFDIFHVPRSSIA